MKILVLMPLDEKSSYAATAIFSALLPEVKDISFSIPMFMEYLMATKVTKNWESAAFYGILSAQQIFEAAEDKDLIIFGNIDKSYEFDAVFNFQDIEESLKYKDGLIEKLKEKCADEEVLLKYIGNLHAAEESKLALHNCIATADFLSKYIKTDPHLEEIKAEYERGLKNERV